MTWGTKPEVKGEWVSQQLQLNRVEEEAKDASVIRSRLFPKRVISLFKLYYSAELLREN